MAAMDRILDRPSSGGRSRANIASSESRRRILAGLLESGLFTTRLEQSGQKIIGVEFISEDIVVEWCALAFAENGQARIIN